MYTNDEYNALLGPRDAGIEQEEVPAASQGNGEQLDEDVEMSLAEEDAVEENEGVQFVQGLVDHWGIRGRTFNKGWSDGMETVFRLYQETERTFRRDLYEAACDLFPASALDVMVERDIRLWEGDIEAYEVWLDTHFTHEMVVAVLADAIAFRSSAARVHPEMIEAEREGRNHQHHTSILRGVYKVLRPEYRRWYGNAAVSLAGVRDEMEGISEI